MKNSIESRVTVFHNFEHGCAGIIVSEPMRNTWVQLRCAECGAILGTVDNRLLSEILDLVPGAESEKPNLELVKK